MAAGVAPALASHAPGALVGSRLVVGAGEGAMMAAAVLWLLRLAGPERRGRALGHIGLAHYARPALWAPFAPGRGAPPHPGFLAAPPRPPPPAPAPPPPP